MKTYPKQKIGSRAYIGESMVKILICDDEKLLFTITRINVQLYFYGLCICSRTLR